MKWHVFHQLTAHDYVPKTLSKAIAALNDEVDKLVTSRASLDRERQQAESANVEDLDFDNLVSIPTYRAALAMLLQTELRLRRRFDELEEQLHAEKQKAAHAACEAHESAKREVIEGLVTLGYVDVPLTSQIQGAIPPGFVQIHPRVRETLGRFQSLRDTSRELKNANLLALEAVEQDLVRLRDRAVSL